MLINRRNALLTVTFSVFGAALALLGHIPLAAAEDPVLADEILKALAPQGATRSLSGARTDSPPSAEQTNLVNTLKKKNATAVAPDERDKLAAIVKDKPSIDISINFDFNSDKIGPAAAQSVKEVAKALSNAQLTGNTFIIAGHTDGKGSDTYNQALSERRAEAVKRNLIDVYKIPEGNLVAVGYGKSKLKNPSNPAASENRRVQIVNMTDKNVAKQ